MSNSNKGFTLIELLVVIAIIGILSSVVLASLNSARNKGADAATKAQLANARAQAELFYDAQSPNSYTNVCTAAGGIASMITGASNSSGGTAVCYASSSAWAVSAPLKAVTGNWCVDSTGSSSIRASAITTSTCS